MSNDFQNPNSLRARTDATDRERKAADSMAWYAAVGHGILILSAVTTLVYFTMATGLGWSDRLPAWVAYPLGALLGILALGAGELAVYRWAGMVLSDNEINLAQRVIAAVCAVLAALSAAVASIIAITFFLPLAMPAGWLEIQQTVNLINLGAGWSIVLIGGVLYAVTSSRSRVNAVLASANNRVDEARANVTRQLATRVEEGAETALEMIDVSAEVVALIAAQLGLDHEATRRKLPGTVVIDQQPEDGHQLTAEEVQAGIDGASWLDDLNATARAVWDHDQQRAEAERLARIAEAMPPASATMSPHLADFLKQIGKTAEELRRMAQTYGLTDPEKAYRTLNRYGYLPDGITRADFDRLFGELMDGATTRPTRRPAANGHGREG